MSTQLIDILSAWYADKDSSQWVLGTLYRHHGPCYRKSGAMMLFNSDGQKFGMLSGGCLESDIGLKAREVMASKLPSFLCYDGSDEDDMAFQLGIGCGGTVYIKLEVIEKNNNYLGLVNLLKGLKKRTTGVYSLNVDKSSTLGHGEFVAGTPTTKMSVLSEDNVLSVPIFPPPHILIAGGGLDARPVAAIAHQLGWQVSLWDPRPANARREYFMDVSHIIKGGEAQLVAAVKATQIDVAIVMTHNISLDAVALKSMTHSTIKYKALLGPAHRKVQVLATAEVTQKQLPFRLAGPAGLDIGGQLPESIALSILSECHAYLEGKTATSHSRSLSTTLQSSASDNLTEPDLQSECSGSSLG